MDKTTLEQSQPQPKLASMKPVNKLLAELAFEQGFNKDLENQLVAYSNSVREMIKYPKNELLINQCLINEVVFTALVKNLLQAKLIDQLTATFNLQIQEFGYRQFLSNGTTMGFCTRNIDDSKNVQNKNLSYQSLKQFYSQQACNSLVIYQRTKDRIEGFYFLSSTNSPEIISYYLNHFTSFQQFISLVSLYVTLVLGSIRCNCNNAYCQNLYNNDLYIKIFGSNSLAELFPEKILNN